MAVFDTGTPTLDPRNPLSGAPAAIGIGLNALANEHYPSRTVRPSKNPDCLYWHKPSGRKTTGFRRTLRLLDT